MMRQLSMILKMSESKEAHSFASVVSLNISNHQSIVSIRHNTLYSYYLLYYLENWERTVSVWQNYTHIREIYDSFYLFM